MATLLTREDFDPAHAVGAMFLDPSVVEIGHVGTDGLDPSVSIELPLEAPSALDEKLLARTSAFKPRGRRALSLGGDRFVDATEVWGEFVPAAWDNVLVVLHGFILHGDEPRLTASLHLEIYPEGHEVRLTA